MAVPVYISRLSSLAEISVIRAVVDLYTSLEDSLTVTPTRYPREVGAAAVDHAVVEPGTVRLEGFISDLQDRDGNRSSVARVAGGWNTLRDLQTRREPVELVTAHATYPDMLITELRKSNGPQDGLSIAFTMALTEIQFASGEREDVPVSGFVGDHEDDGDGGLVDPNDMEDPEEGGPAGVRSSRRVIPIENRSGWMASVVLGGQRVDLLVRWVPSEGAWRLTVSQSGQTILAAAPLVVGVTIPDPPVQGFNGSFSVSGADNPGAPPTMPWGRSHNLIWSP